jgi:hypothetical protein
MSFFFTFDRNITSAAGGGAAVVDAALLFRPAKGLRLPIKEVRAGAFFGGGAGSSSYSA